MNHIRRVCFFFGLFFKQKTAYERRISDWSSDVCSSDLIGAMYLQELVVVLDLGLVEHSGPRFAPALLITLRQGFVWRSEARRVGKECLSTCRSRWSPYH